MKTSSIQKTASIAGFLYLLLIPLGFFGILYVPMMLVVPSDATITANNIIAHESLFRLSIVSALAQQIVGIFLALFLYKILKPASKNGASLMVILFLVSVPITMFNEINHFAVLQLIDGANYLQALSTDQLHSQIMFFFDLHHYGILITQIFWGLWLLPMGYAVYKSGFLPKVIGILLIVAGFGYVIDSILVCLFPGANITVSTFTFTGEVALLLWLLFKGVNVERWEKRALE